MREGILNEGIIDEDGTIRGCLKLPLDYFPLPLTEKTTQSKKQNYLAINMAHLMSK